MEKKYTMFSHLLITTREPLIGPKCLVQDESLVVSFCFSKINTKIKLSLTFKSKLIRHESEGRVTDNLKKPEK